MTPSLSRVSPLLAVILLLGCGSDDSSDATTSPKLEDGPGAFTLDYATSEAFFTQMTAPRKGLSASPHNIVQIFYSKNIQPVITKTTLSSVPTGTVAIKIQDFDGDGTQDMILDMVKQAPGFDPDFGDWLYERHNLDGTVVSSSADSFCIDCHSTFSQTDYLAGTSVRD